MRAPLSWLSDFAAFGHRDPAELVTTLDDLGLVVEGVEHVGEGLGDIVVVRVTDVAPIEGADKIRLATVDAGDGVPLEIVCGAHNFGVGDLVPLAPIGAVLPGGMEITRRKMRGVVSNGMLCSGRELGLSEDHEGLLILTEVEGARPGLPVTEALGIEPDVVFDITVEGNRPDAWCMAGVARDLAARLGLAFTLPDPAPAPDLGVPVGARASLVIEDLDLCPRMVVRVIEGVTVGPSPRWMARRLAMAGMRPINNVVDASNYVMLELGQPTHPYDLDRLAGGGLVVRRATRGERLATLDGIERTVGTPGRGLGDTGEDCLICDAEGSPVGIAGIMGGASSEITDGTTRVLLEVAYFSAMAIARTSKRLALRTEASARFERGTDPWGIDRAASRFCELVGAPAAASSLDVRGDVPMPQRLSVSLGRVTDVLGVDLDGEDVARLIEPIGFACEPSSDAPTVEVTVPTFRPDVRPAPHGIDDIVEEIARTYGYSRIPRRQPAWPEPGSLTARQRERRLVADVLCGLGALEAWTPSLVDRADHERMGLPGREIAVANPIAKEEGWLRRSMLPGLLRALAYNANRRQGAVRFFEIGTVFTHPDDDARITRSGTGGGVEARLPSERELLSVVLHVEDDDARAAVAVWRVLADALGLAPVRLVADGNVPGVHPTRGARLETSGRRLGVVGEIDPAVLEAFGVTDGRVGWLELDLGALAAAPRRPDAAQPVSRYPSSDVDVALVVADEISAADVAEALETGGGALLESVVLFDVYRGTGVVTGSRSLAFRLRFCAQDRTLTDEEVGSLREACIMGAANATGATLR